MITLDQAIDTVSALPPEQQEMLIDIIYKRHIAKQRQEIAADAQKSIAAFRRGELQAQSAEMIVTQLRNDLDEIDDA